MTFWIERTNETDLNHNQLYELHYGHGESAVVITCTKQTLVELVIELRTLLEAEGF